MQCMTCVNVTNMREVNISHALFRFAQNRDTNVIYFAIGKIIKLQLCVVEHVLRETIYDFTCLLRLLDPNTGNYSN